MIETPRGMRLHIGIFGRRNVGKSCLMNLLSEQDVSIVSDVPGTTTDVVTKPFELKPLGPVLFLDTAGMDDVGELGQQRVLRTINILDRVDIAFIVTDTVWGESEKWLVEEFSKRNLPFILVFNKCDLARPDAKTLKICKEICPNIVEISTKTGTGLNDLRNAIINAAPNNFFTNQSIVADLISPGNNVVLVVPIDLEAPKGRLILPQVQTIREILDCDAKALVVKERELSDLLNELKTKPRLVITDSQAILKVSADVPSDIPLTSFSVLFARLKGDLETFVRGAKAIDLLKPNQHVLILESCSHHPIGEDIGRVKIPRWLQQYVGDKLHFHFCTGHNFPSNLKDYNLIIHCGACMTNRREVLSRIIRAKENGVPISNYGLVIAKSLGVLKRILSPFPLFSDIID